MKFKDFPEAVINENVDLKSKQENKENSVRELKKTLLMCSFRLSFLII